MIFAFLKGLGIGASLIIAIDAQKLIFRGTLRT
jgi:arginine exporter protein ArgO